MSPRQAFARFTQLSDALVAAQPMAKAIVAGLTDPDCGALTVEAAIPELEQMYRNIGLELPAFMPVAEAEPTATAVTKTSGALDAPPPAPNPTPGKPIHALDAIFEQRRLRVQDVAVYAYLWRRAGKQMVCWPSQDNIAKACHVKRGTVNESLARLKLLGAVSWKLTGRKSGQGGMYNRYTLHPPTAWNASTLEAPVIRGAALTGSRTSEVLVPVSA